MKNIFIVLLFSLILTSCNKLEKDIQGNWVIDQAYYNNKPVIWDLYHNSLELKSDKTCELPPINNFKNRTKEETIGKWDICIKNQNKILTLNTSNKIFNRTFEIHNLRKVQDTVSWGYLMKMTLTADSLKLDCTKALYE